MLTNRILPYEASEIKLLLNFCPTPQIRHMSLRQPIGIAGHPMTFDMRTKHIRFRSLIKEPAYF